MTYILISNTDYEGSELDGAFASLEEAKNYADDLIGDFWNPDSQDIFVADFTEEDGLKEVCSRRKSTYNSKRKYTKWIEPAPVAQTG